MNMKNYNKVFEEEAEKTLKAFDNDVSLEENPFLYARILAKRENSDKNKKKWYFSTVEPRRVLLFMIIMMNLITVVYFYEWNTRQNLRDKLVAELKADFQVDELQNNY